jgi:hypothetical protein
MARLKLFFVAVAVAALGGWYLSQRAEGEASRIRREADDRLRVARTAISAALGQESQGPLNSIRALAQSETLTRAMDPAGKPGAEALETARASLEKVQSADAERPVLIVVAAEGTAARYRVGQSNRVDPDLSAYPALTEPGPLPRSGIAELDGEAYRFAVAQFEDLKAPGSKGFIAVGFPIDDAFAQRLSSGIEGLDVSILQKGKILGSTLPAADRQSLQSLSPAATGIVNFGALSGDRFVLTDLVPPLVQLMKLPLLVQGHRYRGRVLDAEPGVPPDIKMIAAVKTGESYGLISDEQRELLAGIALLVLICVILSLTGGSPARGLRRVVSAAERIVQGDLEARAPTAKMTALVRRAAVAINTLASQAELASKPAVPTPNLAEQLGIRAGRTSNSLIAIPTPSQPPPMASGEETRETGSSVAFVSEGSRPPAPIYVASQPSPVTQPPISYGLPSEKSSPSQEPVVLPQKPKPVPAPAPAFQPELNEGNDATVIMQTPQALLKATQPSPAPQRPPAVPQPRPSGPSPVPLPGAFTDGSEEAHFQQVYRDFVATKEKCGEPADGLTFEKFAAKLRKNQEQLIAKYACRTVRFQVYVKDGKTALKAQPIR